MKESDKKESHTPLILEIIKSHMNKKMNNYIGVPSHNSIQYSNRKKWITAKHDNKDKPLEIYQGKISPRRQYTILNITIELKNQQNPTLHILGTW